MPFALPLSVSPALWQLHLPLRSATASRGVRSACVCHCRSVTGSSWDGALASRPPGPWRWPRQSPPVAPDECRNLRGRAVSVPSLDSPASSDSSSSRTRIARDRGPGRPLHQSSWTSLRRVRCSSLDYGNFARCRRPTPELPTNPGKWGCALRADTQATIEGTACEDSCHHFDGANATELRVGVNQWLQHATCLLGVPSLAKLPKRWNWARVSVARPLRH